MDDTLLSGYDLAAPVELFELPRAGIVSRTIGVRTANGEFVWKTYQSLSSPASILYEHRLLAWLAAAGLSFAVPQPVPNRDGQTLTQSRYGWSALFPRLSGQEPDRHDIAQIEQVGAALGELHRALRAYPPDLGPGMFAYGDLERHHPRIPDPYQLAPGALGLPDRAPYSNLFDWWRAELSELRPFIDGSFRRLPLQMIHGDYGPAQTLFDGGRLSAVLDFEFTMPDARAIDVATGLEFSMRVAEAAGALERAQAFCRGYAERARLTRPESEAIPALIRLRDVTAAIFWFGRSLSDGSVRRQLDRIRAMQQTKDWLIRHGAELRQMLSQVLVAG